MDHRRLSYFVALVDEHSFGRAAERLFITQPALSQQIQRLEQDIGAPLLDRTVRPFELTPAGQRIYLEAQSILESFRELSEVSDDVRAGRIGRLRVGIAPSLLFGPIPSWIREFTEIYPGVDFQLDRMDTSVLKSYLSQRRLDVLFLFTPSSLPEALDTELYREPHLVALPARHPLAGRRSLKLKELAGERFIMFPRHTATENHDTLIGACVRAGFSPMAKIVLGTYLEHVGIVAAGLGVAVVPATISRFSIPDVVYIPLSTREMELGVHMCWLAGNTDSVAKTFVTHINQSIPSKEVL
jgi:DNA-binding transcriptional LysR family regulator